MKVSRLLAGPAHSSVLTNSASRRCRALLPFGLDIGNESCAGKVSTARRSLGGTSRRRCPVIRWEPRELREFSGFLRDLM